MGKGGIYEILGGITQRNQSRNMQLKEIILYLTLLRTLSLLMKSYMDGPKLKTQSIIKEKDKEEKYFNFLCLSY